MSLCSRACIQPRAEGKTIVTIEGLTSAFTPTPSPQRRGGLHPLQQAFVEHGAVQCGFCIPGQIMTAYALLERNPNPMSDEIRFALKDTLCRCAGYQMIENSILAAAETLRTGEPVKPPRVPDSIHNHDVVGHTQVRPDAVDKVNGKAIYTDDL